MLISRSVGTGCSTSAMSEGTTCQIVTPAAASATAMSGPLALSASVGTTTRAPTKNAVHIVSTDMSNARLNPPKQMSLAVSASTALSQRTRWQALACVIITPLGRPVVPEV